MRRLLALPLIVLLLVGCPKPTPPGPPQGGPKGGGTSGPASPDGGGSGGEDGGGGDGGAAAADVPDWNVIPEDVKETIYPTLQPMTRWPAPTGLKAIGDVKADARPPESRVQQLKQLVESVISPDLQPADPDAALGLDAAGHLFMKLGKSKTTGSASMDLAPSDSPFPVFAITLESPGAVKSLDDLRAQVAKAVNRKLARELSVEDNQLEGHPQLKAGERLAGLALLDRNGFGMQFPYLYAYASKDHLMIVLQEVPHMTAPAEGK